MKKLICVLIISLITATASFAQIRNLSKRITELKASGVDTLIIYNSYCNGCYRPYDLSKRNICQSFDQQYLVWLKDGRNYVQLFDECYTYNILNNSLNEFVNFIKLHISAIKSEEIKPIQYKTIYQGKEVIATTEVDHSHLWVFDLYVGSETIRKTIDGYRLSEFTDSSFLSKGYTGYNINYTYNQNTYLNRVKNLIEQKVKELKFEISNN